MTGVQGVDKAACGRQRNIPHLLIISTPMQSTLRGVRLENVRRIAHIASLFQQAGHVVIVATISPLVAQRELARSIVGAGFLETFISAPAELCSQRDPKGMYAQARLGKIAQFTGVSAPYEVPGNPDLVIDTSHCRVESAVATIVLRLRKDVRSAAVKGGRRQL